MAASNRWDNPVLDTAFLEAVAELGSERKP